MDKTDSVARAAQLAPQLAARAQETVQARRMLAENAALLREAGLFRTLQPARWGGDEASLHQHLDIVEAIAGGCGATGWCLGVMHAHSWLMGLFTESAQRDVYGADPDARIAAVLAPRGKARRTADGYVLSGFWPFCSGCHHAQWLIFGASVADDAEQAVDEAVFLIPSERAAIQDDWYAGGLAGTGSNSVVVKDLVVPAHRALSMTDVRAGQAPGAGLHRTSLYYAAAVPALALFLCGPALGIARRALETFIQRLPGRTVAYTFQEKQIEMPVTHLEVAEAATKLDAARLLLHSVVDEIESWAERRQVMPVERRVKARMDCAYAVRLCLESTELLYLASGGAGLAESSTIQLAARDLHAINMHGMLAMKTNLETYGRTLLGLAPNTPTL